MIPALKMALDEAISAKTEYYYLVWDIATSDAPISQEIERQKTEMLNNLNKKRAALSDVFRSIVGADFEEFRSV